MANDHGKEIMTVISQNNRWITVLVRMEGTPLTVILRNYCQITIMMVSEYCGSASGGPGQ